MEKFSDHPIPFGKKLKDSGFAGGSFRKDIKAVEGSPNKLIRVRHELGKGKYSERKLDRLKIFKGLINELRDEYQIAVPDFDYVIGEDKRKKLLLYSVVDKIDGVALNTVEKIDGEYSGACDQLCCSLLKYIEDKYKSKNPYLYDIYCLKQYVIGVGSGEDKKKIWMADLDQLVENDIEGNKEEEVGFFYRLKSVADMIDNLEKKLGGITLNIAREQMKKIIEESAGKDKNIDSESKYYINRIKKIIKEDSQ